jgi:hypothetical protein
MVITKVLGPVSGGGGGGSVGPPGLGWTGGSYDAGTGVVTFTSSDGLEFATGDLRGAEGPPGPAIEELIITFGGGNADG